MFKIRTFTSLRYNIFIEGTEVKRSLHFESKETQQSIFVSFKLHIHVYVCVCVCIYAYIYLTKYQFITLNIFLL